MDSMDVSLWTGLAFSDSVRKCPLGMEGEREKGDVLHKTGLNKRRLIGDQTRSRGREGR